MTRTIFVPGNTLKIGDIILSAGYRFTILTQPFIRTGLSGRDQYYFQARAVDNNLPPGYNHVTMAKSTDGLWTVEVHYA